MMVLPGDVGELRARLRGEVIEPADEAYEFRSDSVQRDDRPAPTPDRAVRRCGGRESRAGVRASARTPACRARGRAQRPRAGGLRRRPGR